MEGSYVRDVFLYELLLKHIMLYQKKQEKSKIEVFEPIGSAMFTHLH